MFTGQWSLDFIWEITCVPLIVPLTIIKGTIRGTQVYIFAL